MNASANTTEASSCDAGKDQPLVKLRGDLVFSKQHVGAQQGYVCHDPVRGEFFRLGIQEYQLTQFLDGTRTAAEVASASEQTAFAADEIEVQQLILFLVQQRLVQSSDMPPDAPVQTGDALLGEAAKAISIRLPLIDADPPARRLADLFGWVMTGRGLLAWTTLVISALILLCNQGPRFASEARQIFDPSAWIWVALTWCVIKVFHEAGHAVAARRQGVRVGQGGLILLLLAPIAYVDVTDSWRLLRRWQRVQIALAGVYLELAIAAAAAICWSLSTSAPLSNVMLNVMLAAGPTTLLVNANPLMRLDGYFALADALGIPNLAMHGSRQLSGWVGWLLLGRARPASMLSGWRRPFATIHACASIVYRALWIIGLLLLVSTYFAGLGMVLAAIALVLWVLVPPARWIAKLIKAEDRSRSLRRLAEVGVFLAIVVWASTMVPAPLARTIPVIVRHEGHQVIRATSGGLITAVHVELNQQVAQGEVLFRIENPDLQLQHGKVRSEAAASRVRYRQLVQQSQQGKAQGEHERLQTLLRREQELTSQLSELTVTAPHDGTVLTAHLDRLLGTYAKPGDTLVEIGQADKKQLLASIAQDQLRDYQAAQENESATDVRLTGGDRLCVTLVAFDPSGSTQLPHPALAATAGGPIAVEANKQAKDGRDLKLTEPRFEALIPIRESDAARIHSGQRGSLSLQDNRSIFQLAQDAINHWWQQTAKVLQVS